MEESNIKNGMNIWIGSFLSILIIGTIILVIKKAGIWWYLLLFLIVAPMIAGSIAYLYAVNAKTDSSNTISNEIITPTTGPINTNYTGPTA